MSENITYIANKTTLACYLIKARKPQNKEEYIKLDKLQGGDFMNFVEDFFNSQTSISRNDERKKTMRIDSSNFRLSKAKRKISGLILSGEYGVESQIIDNVSGEVKHKKKKEEADERPFYFLIHIPKDKDEAILILQRAGNLGIIDIINTKIRETFRNKYQDIIIEFLPMVTKELAQMFVNDGGIRQVTLTKYIHPSDIGDKVRLKDHKEKRIAMELRFKAPRGGFLNVTDKVKKFIQDPNSKIFSLKGMSDLGFDSDYKASIKVVHNNNIRTVDLSETGQIRPYYDVHNKIKHETSGHPNFKSIDKEANNLLDDILTDLYPIK